MKLPERGWVEFDEPRRRDKRPREKRRLWVTRAAPTAAKPMRGRTYLTMDEPRAGAIAFDEVEVARGVAIDADVLNAAWERLAARRGR